VRVRVGESRDVTAIPLPFGRWNGCALPNPLQLPVQIRIIARHQPGRFTGGVKMWKQSWSRLLQERSARALVEVFPGGRASILSNRTKKKPLGRGESKFHGERGQKWPSLAICTLDGEFKSLTWGK